MFGINKWQELVLIYKLGGGADLKSGRELIRGKIYELSYWSKPEYRNKLNDFYIVKILTGSDETYSFTVDHKYLRKDWKKMVKNHEHHTGIPVCIRNGKKLVGKELIEYMIENFYLGKTIHLSSIPYDISKPCFSQVITCIKLRGVVISRLDTGDLMAKNLLTGRRSSRIRSAVNSG